MELPHKGYWICANSCFHSVDKRNIEDLVRIEEKLVCILKSELIYAVALQGYRELHTLASRILDEKSGFAKGESSYMEMQVLVNLRVTGALASIKSYAEMFKAYLDRIHPGAGREYESRINKKLYSDKLFCLVSLIRNFSQHWDIPVTAHRYSGCRIEGAAKWMPIFSISEALEANSRFRKALVKYGRLELLKAQEEINLLEVIEHVLGELRGLHALYSSSYCKPELEMAIAGINSILKSCDSRFDAGTALISFSDKEIASMQDDRPFTISPSIRTSYEEVVEQNKKCSAWAKIERSISRL